MTYCTTLTGQQVRNVLVLEAERYHGLNGQGDVAQAAKELYYEAREELARRGIDANQVLSDNQVKRI